MNNREILLQAQKEKAKIKKAYLEAEKEKGLQALKEKKEQIESEKKYQDALKGYQREITKEQTERRKSAEALIENGISQILKDLKPLVDAEKKEEIEVCGFGIVGSYYLRNICRALAYYQDRIPEFMNGLRNQGDLLLMSELRKGTYKD